MVLCSLAGPVVAGWGVGFHVSDGLCWWLQGWPVRSQARSRIRCRRLFFSPAMVVRSVVIVPVSGALSGISSRFARARVMIFPAVAKSRYRHRFMSHPRALCPAGSAVSCSQETRFMAREAMVAQAWLAWKSKNGSFPSPVFFRVLTLLYLSSGARGRNSGVQDSVDLPGQIAFDASADLSGGASFLGAFVGVRFRFLVVGHADHGDSM